LAKAAGLAAVRVADFEAARAEPTLDELYILVNVTGLSVDRLFGLVQPRGADEARGLLH
jgi:transcriptional regulator with XRE-family HTH domain